jgi:hypothetical protein
MMFTPSPLKEPDTRTIAACTCGRVEIEASGPPIISVVCYCDDCQEGANRIEALPGAARILDTAGGSAYVAYRKDRVTCTRGAALLTPYKVRATSVTNRVVASCCNSAMLLNFDDGKHWVDIYRERIRGAAPPAQMHLCTRFERAVYDGPRDVPRYRGYPFKFVAKLIKARLAMSLARIVSRKPPRDSRAFKQPRR